MMKRSGANMRRRTEPMSVGNEPPRGPLTQEELAAVRSACKNGCRGTVVIGMRGEERVVTMLVPDTTDASAQSRLLAMRAELRRLGCDGMCTIGRRNQVLPLQT